MQKAGFFIILQPKLNILHMRTKITLILLVCVLVGCAKNADIESVNVPVEPASQTVLPKISKDISTLSADDAIKVANLFSHVLKYYHMNWGWEGLSNGWFLINKLQPSSDMNLSYNISIIRNIMPAGSTNLEQNQVNTNDEIIYDILGRVVTEMTPGNMYIKGGKKFIAR